ncbi:hypothetical protein J4732_09110 [Serratia marcescens]|uniref:Uncharacterized protein n=1 Tax=Serratia marcescens TaxID=615 RepID=A0A939SNM6_SERMA|nr:hypothetical protein [Serratia marcescens]
MIAIHRHNIVGGEIMLYDDSHHDPFFKKRWRTVKLCCWQTANCGTTPPINAVSPKKKAIWISSSSPRGGESMTFTPELARRQFSALSQHIDGKPAIFSTAPAAQVSRGVLEK